MQECGPKKAAIGLGSGLERTFLRKMPWMNWTVMADLPTPPEPITTSLTSIGMMGQFDEGPQICVSLNWPRCRPASGRRVA